MTNPLDDYLGMRKQAFGPMGPGFTKKVLTGAGEGAAQALGQGAVGLGATGLGIAGLKVWRALHKRRDFKGMMAANPDLGEYHEQDPAKFNAHYNSMRVMVPAYASDPIISGSLMRNMSMNPETAGSVLMHGVESSSKAFPGNNRQVTLNNKMTEKGMESGSTYRF